MKKIISSLILLFFTATLWASNGPYKVVGVGRDSREARQDAFKQAIESAIGVVIVSEAELRNSKITREEIITYSSGYVEKYTITRTTQIDDKLFLHMDVWVASNKISERILSSTLNSTKIDGHALATQSSTFINSKKGEDDILRVVLQDYPTKAFDIKHIKTSLEVDSRRRAFVNLDIETRWNQNWLAALTDSLRYSGKENVKSHYNVVLNHKPNAIFDFNRWMIIGLFDNKPIRLLYTTFDQKRPVIKVTLVSSDGIDIHNCYNIADHVFYNAETTYNDTSAFKIYNWNSTSARLQFEVKTKEQLSKIVQVKYKVVAFNMCNNLSD